jgi:hypothetical protein
VQQKKEKKERKDEGKEEEKGETQSGWIKMSDLRELAQMRKDWLIDEEEYGELKKNIIS